MFASTNFNGSDGTKDCSTTRIDSDAGGTGATSGNIRAFAGTVCWNFTGNCLRVLTANAGDMVSRAANLTTATSATLTLWRNNQMYVQQPGDT